MRVATEPIDDAPGMEPEQPGPRLGGTDVFRGSLVILTAVVIGGFIIGRGLSPADTSATDEVDPAAATIEGDATGDIELTPVDPLGDEETTSTTEGPIAAVPTESTEPPADAAEVTPGVEAETDTEADTETETGTDDEATSDDVELAEDAQDLRPPEEVKVLVLNGAQTQGIAGRGTETLKAGSYLTGEPKNATSQRPSAIYYVETYEAEALAVAEVFGPNLDTLVQPLDPEDIPIDDTQDAHILVVIGADQLIPIF